MNVLEQLMGKTIVEVKGERFDEAFMVKTDCGLVFTFYHEQDCCESVYLEDVIGDIDDLLGEVILAEECSNQADPVDVEIHADSWTWTFYRLATVKGLVVLRFFGESNGYYSESVSVSVQRLGN